MRVSLPDGRTLACADLGRPDGRCVFFFHGAPMSRLHLAPRVVGAAVVAGVTDMAWPPAWAGYLEGRPEIPMMRLSEEEAVMHACVERFGADGGGFLTEPFTLPAPDEAMLADEVFARGLDAAIGEAFAQGVRGYAQDVYLEGRGWPFDPGRIRVPVDVIHGDADALVPVAHSRHTADVIPGATFRLLPGHGHFTILQTLPSLAAARLHGAPR